MGQYYRAVLIDGKGKVSVMSPTDYNNGYKLTEHSWVGNSFLNAVMHRLEGNPCRLVWMGDYAIDMIKEDANEDGTFHGMPISEATVYYNKAWDSDTLSNVVREEETCDLTTANCEDYYIVNKTEGEYIDMERYIAAVRDGMSEDSEDYNWISHPLSLLTAIGNGLGGGDFRGEGDEYVGEWAFDEIYVTRMRPSKLCEADWFIFKE